MAHKTYIREVDGSKRVVLFIHGFLGSTEHFERFIELIPDNISVYNILLKGHGAGVRDFAAASMAEWKAQTEEIFRELSRKYNEIYIVGHSMGTFFAIESAIRYPDKVKSVYLLQPPLKIHVRFSAVLNTMKSFFNILGDETCREYRNSNSVKLNFRVWEYIGWIPRYIELFRESKRARDLILSLDVPCMVFQSAKDELVSIKSVKYIPQKENFKLSVLEKSAHFIYDEEEEVYLKDIFCKMIKADEV